MGHTATLSASVTVALCGVLTLGPAAVATPEARTAPSTSAASSAPVTSSDTEDSSTEDSDTKDSDTKDSSIKDKDREKLASTFRTATKFGAASQKTGKVAGLAINGEKDEKKLQQARKDSDQELDNLMAIIPGGSPATTDGRAGAPPARVDLKSSVELIKADTKALVEAALKADVEALTTAGGTLMVHLGQLATTVFMEIGLGSVKEMLPKLPALGQLPSFPGLPGAEAPARR
ncbi:hypothetical protein [Streptomyces sp. NPDC048442]|uniref:hypothetical protein n=1 Tax=Streptomyces sp. NPDC048442 TaxID=3154823 RepID=UPI00343E7429